MAPTDTPWNAWADVFPGSVLKGPVASKFIMFAPLAVFLVQAMRAAYLFYGRKEKKKISKFYSAIIIMNITAMGLVVGPLSLNGLLIGFSNGEEEYGTIPLIIWYISVILFCAHSVNNCCRVVFDAYGLRAAIRFIPVAVLLQIWQVVALPFGFSPFLGFVVLSIVDYIQHTVGLVYWLRKLFAATGDAAKRRLWCGVRGVVLHMISIIPNIFYVTSIPNEEQTTVGLTSVYVCTVLLMFCSQSFWVSMALQTPPADDDKDQSEPEAAKSTTSEVSDLSKVPTMGEAIA